MRQHTSSNAVYHDSTLVAAEIQLYGLNEPCYALCTMQQCVFAAMAWLPTCRKLPRHQARGQSSSIVIDGA